MKKFFQYCICAIMLMLSSAVFAQSNGDKLFMEGQQLQQTQTVNAQNQAIKKFQAAKVVYTTADKKKMCDNQISICQSNIASIKKGGGRKVAPATTKAETVKFSLSQNSVEFDGDEKGELKIAVISPTMDWTFNLATGIEGEQSFAKVSRSNDAKSITIEVDANPTTLDRFQSFKVAYGEESQTVSVVQHGKTVTLSTNTNLVEFKSKGGNKTIELYTNSDSIISSNNGLTWYVLSKPEWVEISVDVAKEKSTIGKGLNALKGLVTSTATAATAEDVKPLNVKIVALPLLKGSSEAQTGRKGEIVFASQDKTYKINVIQQK